MDNDFLKNLDSSQVREIVDSMYSKEFLAGKYVIREGEAGAHLYVSAEGEFQVIKEDKVLGRMGAGKAFGELAILYNCTRTASIRGRWYMYLFITAYFSVRKGNMNQIYSKGSLSLFRLLRYSPEILHFHMQ